MGYNRAMLPKRMAAPPPTGITATLLAAALLAAALLALGVPDDLHAGDLGRARAIGFEAARLAPPDLYRQLVRNHPSFALGLTPNEAQPPAPQGEKNPDGSGTLDQVVARRVQEAIAAIRQHRPFNEVAYRLGRMAYQVSCLNDPLATDRSDPEEQRFAADYHRYTASTRARIRPVFYGFHPGPADRADRIDALVADALDRGRTLYPLIGREYRRVGFASGVRTFDDRSTAYAVSALTYNHAISDVAEALRYIWIVAGGRDPRTDLPVRGGLLLPPSAAFPTREATLDRR